MKHTPGPWKAVEKYDGWVIEQEKTRIKIGREIDSGRDMGEADAKLIAAAPDMLEALNRCVSCLEHMAKHPEYYSLQTEERSKERYDMVMSAIKKATE